MSHALIVFVAFPDPARVKPRLAATVGPDRAAVIGRSLAESTLAEVRTAWDPRAVTLAVDDPAQIPRVADWLGRDFPAIAQEGADLRARLLHAATRGFASGAASVTLLGSDCPLLTARHLEAAQRALEDDNVVLGPTADGGAYVIGLPRALPDLFREGSWDADGFAHARAWLEQAEVPFALLPVLSRVETEADLPVWLA